MPPTTTKRSRRATPLVIAGVSALVLAGAGIAGMAAIAGSDEPAAPAPAAAPAPMQTTRPAPRAPAPDPAPAARGEFPNNWYFPDRRTGKRYQHLIALEGKKAPALVLEDWIGDAPTRKSLEGKVIVVDFWATWCRPCMAAIPENVEMMKKYGDKGLAIIGVHDGKRGWEKMGLAVQRTGINYPVGIDRSGNAVRDWHVLFWPTYAVIDHKGVVRAAGLVPTFVESVVRKLLKEREADLGAG